MLQPSVLARICIFFSKKGVIKIFEGVICKREELSVNDENCAVRRANWLKVSRLHAQNIQNRL